MRVFRVMIVGALLLSGSFSFAQTSGPANDSPPTASSVLSGAEAAFSGATVVTDVGLKGTATAYAGSTTRSGPVTLLADSQGRSKVTYSFENGTRIEYASGHAERADCEWVGVDGTKHQTAIHNCWTPGTWFLPPLSYTSAATGTDLEYLYLGRESRPFGPVTGVTQTNATQEEHLRFKRTFSTTSPAMTQKLHELSAMELFLDLATLLPQSLEFKIHPDNDIHTNLPVEIKYSDYRDEDGVKLPFHIQRFVNGSLSLEITISSVSVNSGTQIQK